MLEEKLYGQHILVDIVVNSVEGHVLRARSPPKPIVVSFHGATGVGKNYVSRLIADSLFSKGIDSRFYKEILCSVDFAHNELVQTYNVGY